MKRARALSVRRKTTVGRSTRNLKVLLAASAATLSGMLLASSAPAATLTWTGTVVDPSSGGGAGSYTPSAAYVAATLDTPPANPYRWTNDATNWSGGTYAPGGNVVFTDNFSGGTAIRLSNSAL